MTKRILQIDGGGLKGIIPAIVLAELENELGKKCCEVFDLITGTSTGAIIGGILATGVTPASLIQEMYVKQGPKLFTPRVPMVPFIGTLFGGSMYDRKPFIEQIRKFTADSLMKNVKTEFMATAMNLCSGRTHYIYSTEPFEENYPVWKVISWSGLSAAVYFGKINEPKFVWDNFKPDDTITENIKGAVFQDGGQGINNCNLGAATIDAFAKRWVFDDEVTILSLGCGDYHKKVPYKTASKTRLIRQIWDFVFQARNEAAVVQYMAARDLSLHLGKKYNLIRVNCGLDKEADMLDGVKWISLYVELANNMVKQLRANGTFMLFK